MSISKFEFTKRWTNPTDFPTHETSEAQVRSDMQALHDESRNYIDEKLIPEVENELALKATKDEIRGIVLGQIPDGTLTHDKLSAELQAELDDKATQAQVEDRYTKGETLTSSAKALFGFDELAVPDSVFRFLGKYNQHWWLARPNQQYWKDFNENYKSRSLSFGRSSASFVLYCADTISIDSDGVVSLSGEVTEVTFSYDSYENVNAVAGKYFYREHSSNFVSVESGKVYYIDPDTTASRSSNDSGSKVSISCYEVNAYLMDPVDPDSFYYVHSGDRSAYEDDENAIYTYLGIPFENAVTANVRTAFGSYVGTGTYGADNLSSITVPFTPKVVVIEPATSGNGGYPWLYGVTEAKSSGNTLSAGSATLNWSDVGVSWYSESALKQLNVEDTTYYYFAIG